MDKRIRELDGIRGIAILMVLVWHYFTCQDKTIPKGGVLSHLQLITVPFSAGVDLFFVLSGFLIGGIILDNHAKQGFLKVFWIRRACRILPVYFALLAACVLGAALLDPKRFAWLFHELMPWWSYATFTQNLVMALKGSFGGHFLGITWSLAVEEQFYILAPLLILLAGERRFVRLLLPLALLAFLLRIASPGFHAFVLTFFRMDCLLLGVFVAAVSRHAALWSILLTFRGVLLTLFGGMVAVTWLILYTSRLGVFQFSWYAVLFALFVLVALLYRGSRVTAVLRSRFLCFWGSIAYGFYMVHQAVSGLLHGWLREGAAPALTDSRAVGVTVLALLVSILLASISLRTFERFFLDLGKRHSYGAPRKGGEGLSELSA